MFHRLHFYTVHEKPGNRQKPPVFVREGFAIWGFVFAMFWLLYHRLWLAFAINLAYNLGVIWLAQRGVISEGAEFALLLAQQLLIGFEGRDVLRAKLKRKGYITTNIVAEESQWRAERRHFEQSVPAQ